MHVASWHMHRGPERWPCRYQWRPHLRPCCRSFASRCTGPARQIHDLQGRQLLIAIRVGFLHKLAELLTRNLKVLHNLPGDECGFVPCDDAVSILVRHPEKERELE